MQRRCCQRDWVWTKSYDLCAKGQYRPPPKTWVARSRTAFSAQVLPTEWAPVVLLLGLIRSRLPVCNNTPTRREDAIKGSWPGLSSPGSSISVGTISYQFET